MREKTDRELQIKAETLTCRHFNGVHHEVCRAGVNYRVLTGGPALGCMTRLPCFLGGFEPKGGPRATCEQMDRFTLEEATANIKRGEQAIERHMSAFRAAHDDAKAKGLKRGHGGRGDCKCPVCKKGMLRYLVSDYNGHMHATCSTDGCVSWME